MRTRTTAARLGTVVLVSLLAMGALAPGASGSARTKPRIFIAHRDGPVAILEGVFGYIGALRLPQGRWVLVATLTLENTSTTGVDSVCELKLGASSFRAEAFPATSGVPLPVTLMTVGRSTGTSSARVRCVAYGGSLLLEASDLEILAIQAGRVTTYDLNDGSTSRVGHLDAGVRVVTGLLDGARLAGSPGSDTVAEMPLPAGEWVHLGVANVGSQAASNGSVECRLDAGGDFDIGQVRVESQNFSGSVQTLTLAVAHSYASPGSVRLDCWSELSSTAAAIGDIQFVALRAGVLTNRGGGGQWTLGDAANGPRMLVGWDNGPDPLKTTMSPIGTLDVPSGAWAGFAKTWLQRSSGLTDTASCQVRFAGAPIGRSAAGVLATGSGNSLTDHTVAAAAAGTAASPTQLVVRCAGGPAAADLQSRFLKMVAIRGGSVTRRAA